MRASPYTCIDVYTLTKSVHHAGTTIAAVVAHMPTRHCDCTFLVANEGRTSLTLLCRRCFHRNSIVTRAIVSYTFDSTLTTLFAT